jgi:hypothetical protein
VEVPHENVGGIENPHGGSESDPCEHLSYFFIRPGFNLIEPLAGERFEGIIKIKV